MIIMELCMHTSRRHPNPMILLCLVAVGLLLTISSFLFFRDTGEGYQDELGFHENSKSDAEL